MKARNEGTNEVLKLLFLASFDHKTNAKIFNKKGFKRAIVLSPVFFKELNRICCSVCWRPVYEK